MNPELKRATAVKLLSRSKSAETGCLRWQGAHVPKGYGQISVEGRVRQVHRIAYEVWNGPIPEGFEIDHVHAKGCRYRDCIEPSHLEAVTHAGNVSRSSQIARTHCPKGHELFPENLKIVQTRKGYPSRRCRRCFNDARNASRARKREQGRG